LATRPQTYLALKRGKRGKRGKRPSASKRGYDSEWKTLRRDFLYDFPACNDCGKPAELVHHLIELGNGGTNARRNLMALCRKCHAIRHEGTN